MSRRHRHFLALPLAVGCVIATAVGNAAMHASVVLVEGVSGENAIVGVPGDARFSFPQIPAAGTLSDGGRAHKAQGRLWLDDGAMLITSPAMAIVRADDMELTVFKGAFMVIRGTKGVTAMALTAPVLVRSGGYRFVLPTGFQADWSKNDLPTTQDLTDVSVRLTMLTTILPETRVNEMAKLSTLDVLTFPPFPEVTEDLWPSFLLLPSSIDRAEDHDRLHAFVELRRAVEAHDVGAAHAALRHPLVQSSLLSSPDAEILRTLIALAEDTPSIERELIQYVRDPDLWLLLSLHPRFSLAAWETDGPVGAPLSARTQRFLQFPSSDVAQAHGAVAIRQWQKQLTVHLKNANDPVGFLSLLLKSLVPYRAFAAEHDLPERLLRYAVALRELSEPYLDSLSTESRGLLDAWTAEEELPEYRDVEPLPMPMISDVVEEPVTPVVAPEPERVSGAEALAQETLVKSVLQNVGGLFAVTTKLRAEFRDSVIVEGIVFASEAGDRLFDFMIDLPGKRVTDIRSDGQILPYPMSLEAFASWATGK